MSEENIKEIQDLVNRYFEGIFLGDVRQLESVFHPQALLFGDVNNESYFKDVAAYIEGVKNRKSPSQVGESFRMKVISIEILNGIALIKAHLPMLGFNYYDYLSLAKNKGKWLVVNKLFTHTE